MAELKVESDDKTITVRVPMAIPKARRPQVGDLTRWEPCCRNGAAAACR
jgi:hypothetical protein